MKKKYWKLNVNTQEAIQWRARANEALVGSVYTYFPPLPNLVPHEYVWLPFNVRTELTANCRSQHVWSKQAFWSRCCASQSWPVAGYCTTFPICDSQTLMLGLGKCAWHSWGILVCEDKCAPRHTAGCHTIRDKKRVYSFLPPITPRNVDAVVFHPHLMWINRLSSRKGHIGKLSNVFLPNPVL